MWVLLIMFYRYRSRVQTIAGHSNEDYKWTFGQMLALCAFAPVLVELFSIMIRKLAPKYRSVRRMLLC